MANYMIVRHSVRDYSEFKPGYDSHESARAAAGLTEMHVLQDADDPNMVTVILKAEDLKRAEEFARSDYLREVMQKVGVVGQPDMFFLKG